MFGSLQVILFRRWDGDGREVFRFSRDIDHWLLAAN